MRPGGDKITLSSSEASEGIPCHKILIETETRTEGVSTVVSEEMNPGRTNGMMKSSIVHFELTADAFEDSLVVSPLGDQTRDEIVGSCCRNVMKGSQANSTLLVDLMLMAEKMFVLAQNLMARADQTTVIDITGVLLHDGLQVDLQGHDLGGRISGGLVQLRKSGARKCRERHFLIIF